MKNTKEKTLIFNYDLQAWTLEGVILPCGHLPEMRQGKACCNAWKLQGQKVSDVTSK